MQTLKNMLSQVFYLIRSRQDGQYLVAHPHTQAPDAAPASYLLLFREHFDALSYLNTHGSGVSSQFMIESLASTQLKGVLQRWGFRGIGVVQDPLLPSIEFLHQD